MSVVSDNSTTITSKKSHNEKKGNRKSSTHSGTAKCKGNIAYGLSSKSINSAKEKTKKDENSSSSMTDVQCKENKAYDSVDSGYKVLREVAIALKAVSGPPKIGV